MYYTAVACMLRNNNNSYINCSEQRAHSRSITLEYACIIIVIAFIIIISMCDSVRQCSTLWQCEWQFVVVRHRIRSDQIANYRGESTVFCENITKGECANYRGESTIFCDNITKGECANR
jgi:hypothetical protein